MIVALLRHFNQNGEWVIPSAISRFNLFSPLSVQLVEKLEEALLVVLTQGDVLAIVKEDASLGVARYALDVDDVGAVYAHETIRGERGLHVLEAEERGDGGTALDV